LLDSERWHYAAQDVSDAHNVSEKFTTKHQVAISDFQSVENQLHRPPSDVLIDPCSKKATKRRRQR
jgi:hypothetical protein